MDSIPPLFKGGGWKPEDFLTKPNMHLKYNPKLKERARELRKNMTEPEKKIWYGYLKNCWHNVLRQKPLDQFIVDFYIPKAKLVIEIDGETHFTGDAIEYDSERTAVLQWLWITVIRFTNSEVMTNLEGVALEIERYINVTNIERK